MNKDNSKLGVW